MSAIENLRQQLELIDRAVAALNNPLAMDAAIREHLSRGIAINGLVVVETFLKERMQDWVAFLKAARIPPTSLPGGIMNYGDRVLEVLPRVIRDADYTGTAQRLILLDEIGKSLTSLSSGELLPHHLAFMWAGSNVRSTDIESIVSLISGTPHDRVWSTLTSIWSTVDAHFPRNTSLKNVFDQLAELRHAAAHQSVPLIPFPNLRGTSRNARLVCLCIDVHISRAMGSLAQPTRPNQQAGRILIRKIVQSGTKWPEYGPGRRNAFRRHQDLTVALLQASARARASGELLLVLDKDSNILDWRSPTI